MKPRLFCLGDSFVDWPIPKYHWTYYLSNHYEVIKLGKFGADNYSIIFQLGLLDDYIEGDRIVIMFTDAGRLPRRYYGERKEQYLNIPYKSPRFYKDSKFAEKLDYTRSVEGDNWVNGVRENEIKFLKKLQTWLDKYKPIYLTWSEKFHQSTADFVTLIQVTSNADEKVGEEYDFHPGPIGCYELYKTTHSLLEIKQPLIEFKPEDIEKTII